MRTDPAIPPQGHADASKFHRSATARTAGAQAVRKPFRRALLIFNRTAGGGGKVKRVEDVIARLTEAGVTVDLHETTSAGDAERTAASVKHAATRGAHGPDVVICAGGDGTINEVVNGLAGGDTPLALIPIGTANVLAAEIGLETDPRAVAASILDGRPTRVHLGVANGRHFMLMAGVGLDAEIVASVDSTLKRRTGKLAYAVATLRRWFAYRNRRFRIVIDGVIHEAASAIVANGHYYAGRFVCAGDARITEPGLHVCLFEKPGRWQAVYYMAALFGGFLGRLKTYRVIPAREISVLDGREDPVQGDGDIITRLPVSIAVAAETVSLLMPPREPA